MKGVPVAEVLAARLGAGDAPQQVVAAAWRIVWPARERAARELHLYGARVLQELDQADTAAFFAAFFQVRRLQLAQPVTGNGLQLFVRIEAINLRGVQTKDVASSLSNKFVYGSHYQVL